MHFKLFLPLILSVSVQGSGYFPSIGGPWSRYSTTTPAPGAEGVNLLATEAPPPPSVTFVPRPRPVQPTNDIPSEGNNMDEGYSQNQNAADNNNFLIVTDPLTGEQFTIPKQTFWDRYGNRGVNINREDNEGHSSRSLSESQDRYANGEQGYNRGSYSQFQSQRRRGRRSIESSEEVRRNINDDSQELRHVDIVMEDDSAEDHVDVILLENKEINSGESAHDTTVPVSNAIATDCYAENGCVPGHQSSPNLFKMFFPSLKMDQDKRMIYMYSLYRFPSTDGNEDKVTTSPTTTTTTTTTTPSPTEEPETTALAPLANEIPETTTVLANDDVTEIPQTTGLPGTDDKPNHEDASPAPA